MHSVPNGPGKYQAGWSLTDRLHRQINFDLHIVTQGQNQADRGRLHFDIGPGEFRSAPNVDGIANVTRFNFKAKRIFPSSDVQYPSHPGADLFARREAIG